MARPHGRMVEERRDIGMVEALGRPQLAPYNFLIPLDILHNVWPQLSRPLMPPQPRNCMR